MDKKSRQLQTGCPKTGFGTKNKQNGKQELVTQINNGKTYTKGSSHGNFRKLSHKSNNTDVTEKAQNHYSTHP